MAHINVERTHTLGLEVARVKARDVVAKLESQYGLKPQWSGDKVAFKRSGVDGVLEISENTVKVDVKLGMLMSAMSGMIKTNSPPHAAPIKLKQISHLRKFSSLLPSLVH